MLIFYLQQFCRLRFCKWGAWRMQNAMVKFIHGLSHKKCQILYLNIITQRWWVSEDGVLSAPAFYLQKNVYMCKYFLVGTLITHHCNCLLTCSITRLHSLWGRGLQVSHLHLNIQDSAQVLVQRRLPIKPCWAECMPGWLDEWMN